MMTKPSAHAGHHLRLPAVLGLAVATALCAAGCKKSPRIRTLPAQPAPLADTIAIMSYNVENLFDMTDDGGEYPEYKPNKSGWNDYAFGVKLHNIATVVAAANPGIAAFLEIENGNVLRLLQQEAARLGDTLAYAIAADKSPGTAVTVGLLSRFPILSSSAVPTVDVDGHASRGILQARLLLGADTLVVFVNHWPSKKHKESLRIATAAKLRECIAQLGPGAEYIVVGDLNENYNECESTVSEGLSDSGGLTGLNHVLGTTTSRPLSAVRFITKAELARCSGPCLYDLWLDVAERDRWSYVHRGQHNTLDHILIPASLCDSTGLSYLDRSFRTFTMDGKLLSNGKPFEWQISHSKHGIRHNGAGFSDHLPVMARLYHGPFVADTRIPPADSSVDRTPGRYAMDFEQGTDGWISTETGTAMERDTAMPASGRYCLRIHGATRGQNATIGRVVIPSSRIAVSRPAVLSLKVIGTGELCLRARPAGAKKWTYFTGASNAPSKTAKYEKRAFAAWTAVGLSVAGITEAGRDLELEIREAKNSTFDLRIDEIAVR